MCPTAQYIEGRVGRRRRRMPAKERRSEQLSVYVSPDELRQLEAVADQGAESISGLVRRWLLERLKRERR